MSQSIDANQIYSTFYNLAQELEPFVELSDLKIAFDSQKDVYLLGNDFQEQLHANGSATQRSSRRVEKIDCQTPLSQKN